MSCPMKVSSSSLDGFGSCAWAREAVAFKRWVHDAVSEDGSERLELYRFLTECFKDADVDRDGLVNAEEFDLLVEGAAALPRRFGLAPNWKVLYGDQNTRATKRGELFKEIASKSAPTHSVGIENWIQYAFQHITEKVRTMPIRNIDFANLEASGKNKFLKLLRSAIADETSTERQELYMFLFKNFQKADRRRAGRVSLEDFDTLVELSVSAPRTFGLAPSDEQMYPNSDAKKRARKRLFEQMCSEEGGVSFGDFLKYSLEHIKEKLDSTKSRPDFGLASTTSWHANWQTDAVAFVPWINKAIKFPDGKEREELYTFLCSTFMDADVDRDGYVSVEEFDLLCEKAVALPRRFGLAPTWRELYGTAARRRAARKTLFAEVDTSNRGTIGMEDWIKWTLQHVEAKLQGMEDADPIDFDDLGSVGKEKFLFFLTKATIEKRPMEHTQLYLFLFRNFMRADKEGKGGVTAEQFDYLIDLSAAAPRALGLAPLSFEMFGSDAHRRASRKTLFESMDKEKTGIITFNDYMNYTIEHIAEKARGTSKATSRCPMGFG